MHDKGSKFRQVDWPLGSKKNHYSELAQHFTKKSHNQKHDILVYGKQITLTVEKGTKKITHILNSSFPVEENKKYQSSNNHVCSTCKEEITDISRVLIMRDRDGGPRLLCFHFFYPCWDMELLCQQYPNFIIGNVAFSIPENMSMNQSLVEDMQRNQDLWI